MNCTELRDHYELYALGLAEDPERSEIQQHLARECKVCMTEMKRARGMLSLLGGSAPPVAPSPKLRRRILASVGVEQSGSAWVWTPLLAGVAALTLAAAFYYAGRERQYFGEVLKLREEARGQIMELTRLNEAFAILNGADTTVTSFGENQPKPKGKVFVNPSKGLLLIASNLPQAPAGKAYELWWIPKTKDGKPVRAGMFQSDTDGTVMHMEHGSVDMSTTAAVAVTLEVDSGVDAPTTTPIIVAALPPALQ
jgi:anti-sigma-K factor RskA